MRRGFKTDARNLASEVRAELGLTDLTCLDPRRLAQHLDGLFQGVGVRV